MKDTMVVVGVVTVIVFAIFSPFVTIWCLNTLFPALAIPYTLETYVAALLLNTGSGFIKFKTTKD
jgi:hypothetical protein